MTPYTTQPLGVAVKKYPRKQPNNLLETISPVNRTPVALAIPLNCRSSHSFPTSAACRPGRPLFRATTFVPGRERFSRSCHGENKNRVCAAARPRSKVGTPKLRLSQVAAQSVLVFSGLLTQRVLPAKHILAACNRRHAFVDASKFKARFVSSGPFRRNNKHSCMLVIYCRAKIAQKRIPEVRHKAHARFIVPLCEIM